VRFYFGAMSPYSWFSAERVGEALPGVEWCPVFAGGLFRAQGRVSWGLTQERPAKLADCEARAAAHGLGEIRWPSPWPTNDLLVARGLVAAQHWVATDDFALAAMRLAFREGRDLGEVDAVLEVGERVGIHAAELRPAIGDPEVKARLRAATDAAVVLGVVGVPTLEVGGELFWGDDRLGEAAEAAARHAA
jgi:2-hydroxychromene-2-carboxylate isomerase